jgi:hypothetical protein
MFIFGQLPGIRRQMPRLLLLPVIQTSIRLRFLRIRLCIFIWPPICLPWVSRAGIPPALTNIQNPKHMEYHDEAAGRAARESFRPLVEQIVERWAIGKPPNSSPVATSDKPSGYFRLTGYLLDYLESTGALPEGVHMMPEGRDALGNLEPSFPVDFDRILQGVSPKG